MTLLRRLGSRFDFGHARKYRPGWAADNRAPVTSSDLVTAPQLNSQLPAVKAGKIVLIQVGFHMMYKMGHIPGSQYAGAASNAEGLAALKKLVAKSSPQSGDRHLLRMLSVGRLPQHSPRLSSAEGDGILEPQGARHPRKARRRLDRERIPHCEGRVGSFGFAILD